MRSILLNPGPVSLSDKVRKAAVSTDLCHREADFVDLQNQLRSGLLDVYYCDPSEWIAVLLGGSGTMALEAMLCSLLPADARILVLENGVYGERISRIAKIHGIEQDKLDAIWEYQTSTHYSDAERTALDFALAAGAVPNEVDNSLMSRMKEHWSEDQIVQILGAVCLYGFLNRWNDSMATELEDSPREMGESLLAQGGWTGGKHV